MPAELAKQAATGAMGEVAKSIQDGIAWVVENTVAWWVKVPSPDLTQEPAVDRLQQMLMPIAVAVAMMSMLVAAAKMVITRKANPLIDVGQGLLIIAASSALGVLVPTMLLKAGDSYSNWVLNTATDKDFGKRLTEVLALTNVHAPGVVVVLGTVSLVMASIQAILMVFRQASLVILAGVLPLAASGAMAPGTRPWSKRIFSWTNAFVFYKPAAATVYGTAFTMVGKGKDPRTTFMGLTMILLSLITLPVLMKFFTWASGSVESSGGGGGFLGAAISGAVAVGSFRGSSGGAGGSSAPDHARFMDANSSEQPPQEAPASPNQPPPGPKPGDSGDGGQTVQLANTGSSGTAPSGSTVSGVATADAASSSAAAGTAAGAAGGPVGLAVAAGVQATQQAAKKASGAMTQPPGQE